MANSDESTSLTIDWNGRATPSRLPRAMIWMFGADAKCRSTSKSWLQFRGTTIDQERGDGWMHGLHPDDRRRCVDLFYRTFQSRTVFQASFRAQRADGTYEWVQASSVPQYLNNGKFLGYSGELKIVPGPGSDGLPQFSTSPVPRVRAKRRPRAISAALLQHSLEESQAPLLVLDSHRKAIFFNRAAEPFVTNEIREHGGSPEAPVSRVLAKRRSRPTKAGDGRTKGVGTADSGWTVQLRDARLQIDPLDGGFTVFSLDQADANEIRGLRDRAFIHDLLNLTTAIQAIVELLDDEKIASEERREYVTLLAQTLSQLSSEIENQRSILELSEPRHRRARDASA